ncbi:MAG: family 16 glycoside hydrolase [Planctomycetota bacterium]
MARPALFLCLTVLTALQLGCSQDPGYEHTYTTRAIVLSLPGEKAAQEFIVHHEEIPEYISINGSIGMNEMAMPIPVPDKSLLKGFAVGDKVELVFGERFEPDHTMGLISIKKLSAETEMNLGQTASGASKRAADEDDGFVAIFDGETFEGWEGDMRYWSIEDNNIVGQFDETNPLAANTFLIWRGGEKKGVLSDFELKFQYRISEGGNSGVQYRSQEEDNFGMKGYQADIHHGPRWTGICYDEHGRKVLADRGQSVVVEAGEKPEVVEQFGDRGELMESIDLEGWNEYHIIAKANRLIHKINGVRMSEVLDNDEAERDLEGLLGLQIHRSTPVKVEFKDIRLKVLD